MSHKMIINSNEVKARALYLINNLDIEKPREVVIRDHKANRSEAQKGLYWVWVGIVGNELGNTKLEQHNEFKEHFLSPIYELSRSEHAKTMCLLRALYLNDKDNAIFLKNRIVDLISTNDASVEEFTDYLNEIESHARSLNIFLPHPGDYALALGRAA